MKLNEPYLITRPRLASFLQEAGSSIRPAWNPYNPERLAWEVILDRYTLDRIEFFYCSFIGRPLPKTLQTLIDNTKDGDR